MVRTRWFLGVPVTSFPLISVVARLIVSLLWSRSRSDRRRATASPHLSPQ